MPHHDTHHSHEHEHEAQHSEPHDYLGGTTILPKRIRPNMTITELIDEQYQAYNAARLNEAARLYVEKMLSPEEDVTIGLTMAGALTPAGLGGCLISLMEN